MFLAWARADSDQRFACKIIYKTDMNELQTEMFRNEIACLRLVRHPNIVRMLAMFETPEKVRTQMRTRTRTKAGG